MTDGFKISDSKLITQRVFGKFFQLSKSCFTPKWPRFCIFANAKKSYQTKKLVRFFGKKTNFNLSKRVSLQEQETKQMHGALNIETSV